MNINTGKNEGFSVYLQHPDVLGGPAIMVVLTHDLPLSAAQLRALQSTGSLPLILQLSIIEPNWYWDKEWASITLPMLISYNPLTERYSLRRFSVVQDFTDLAVLQKEVLRFEWAALPQKVVGKGDYQVELKLSVDKKLLPLPLQLEYLSNKAWNWQMVFPSQTLRIP